MADQAIACSSLSECEMCVTCWLTTGHPVMKLLITLSETLGTVSISRVWAQLHLSPDTLGAVLMTAELQASVGSGPA